MIIPVTEINGKPITYRKAQEEDVSLVETFYSCLTSDSITKRFVGIDFHKHENFLIRHIIACCNPCLYKYALLAEIPNGIIGLATCDSDMYGTDFSVVVADKYQRQGVAISLLERATELWKEQGIRETYLIFAPENHASKGKGMIKKATDLLGMELHDEGFNDFKLTF